MGTPMITYSLQAVQKQHRLHCHCLGDSHSLLPGTVYFYISGCSTVGKEAGSVLCTSAAAAKRNTYTARYIMLRAEVIPIMLECRRIFMMISVLV